MFEKLLAAVMSRLGITSFEEKDGKYVLTEEQKVSLAKMYNKDFAEKFEKDLFAMKKEDVDSDNVSAYKKKLEDLQAEYDAFKRYRNAKKTKTN